MARQSNRFVKCIFATSLALGMLLTLLAAEARAGEVKPPAGYPSRTIDFIVPANAGAVLDLYARAFNEALNLGKPLAIRNMGGGSQTIGLMELAGKPANGHSMGITAFAGVIIQPLLVNVTYNLDTFRPVAITSGPNMYTLCTRANSGLKNFEDLRKVIAEGKQTLHWTSPNAGSPGHLAGLYFLKELGATKCEYVSYSGTAEALTALLSGDVHFYVTDDNIVATRQADGQVTGLVTLSDRRTPLLPDLISADEIGVKGMGVFDAFSWVVIRSGTPDNIYAWVKQQIDAAVTSPSYKAFLKKNNLGEVLVYSEQEMKDMIASSSKAIAEVIGLLSK